MADAPPFKRGDIVVYCHPNAKQSEHGSLAIVDKVYRDDKDKWNVDVHWMLLNPYLRNIFLKSGEPESFWETDWIDISFEKVGHLDDF